MNREEAGSTDLAASLGCLLDSEARRVAVSRATDSLLMDALVGCSIVYAPVVRGRAVWDGLGADAFVGQIPNSLGLLDMEPPGGRSGMVAAVVHIGAPIPAGWTDVVSRTTNGWTINTDPRAHERDEFAARTRAAGVLAPAIRQVRRVFVPHGRPESPRFVVQGPVPGERVSDALNREFHGVVHAMPIPAEAAGPGGVSVEVLVGEMTAAVAAEVASVIARAQAVSP